MTNLKKQIYLDYASSTPLDPRVLKVMLPYLKGEFGNPSALYRLGVSAKTAVENARHLIAKNLQVSSQEIIFTAGGTESVNLAIQGILNASATRSPHVITSPVEHSAVLECLKNPKLLNLKVSYLKVDSQGQIDMHEVFKQVTPQTVLVSIMLANNEVGTIYPIAEIARKLGQLNKERIAKKLPRIYFHSDACQGLGLISAGIPSLGVDLLTLNGSKIYGPKQTGLLYIKKGTNINPIILGGGQEKGLRSGTENVAGIVGFGKAIELYLKGFKKENLRLRKLQKYFLDKVSKQLPTVKINGPLGESRLANNINLTLPGIEAESLMFYLDQEGIQVSSGSACSNITQEPSHVLLSMDLSKEDAKSSFRITTGIHTTKSDLDYLLKTLKTLVKSKLFKTDERIN